MFICYVYFILLCCTLFWLFFFGLFCFVLLLCFFFVFLICLSLVRARNQGQTGFKKKYNTIQYIRYIAVYAGNHIFALPFQLLEM